MLGRGFLLLAWRLVPSVSFRRLVLLRLVWRLVGASVFPSRISCLITLPHCRHCCFSSSTQSSNLASYPSSPSIFHIKQHKNRKQENRERGRNGRRTRRRSKARTQKPSNQSPHRILARPPPAGSSLSASFILSPAPGRGMSRRR